MVSEKVEPTSLSVHPVYGAIYRDGEFVQRGAVLGLSVDATEVVVAPISGWVRVIVSSGTAGSLCVEIWQQPESVDGPEAPRH